MGLDARVKSGNHGGRSVMLANGYNDIVFPKQGDDECNLDAAETLNDPCNVW